MAGNVSNLTQAARIVAEAAQKRLNDSALWNTVPQKSGPFGVAGSSGGGSTYRGPGATGGLSAGSGYWPTSGLQGRHPDLMSVDDLHADKSPEQGYRDATEADRCEHEIHTAFDSETVLDVDRNLCTECLRSLAEILSGVVPPHEILFRRQAERAARLRTEETGETA
jgi:hypothetical protein